MTQLSNVSVCYKTYYNTYKGIQTGLSGLSLQDAVDQGLTPGDIIDRETCRPYLYRSVAAVEMDGILHAMVLDTVQQVTMDNQSQDFEEGDYKLIFKNTYDDEENGQPKKFTMKANASSAPDVFYYVHIDVDLNLVDDCNPAYQQ